MTSLTLFLYPRALSCALDLYIPLPFSFVPLNCKQPGLAPARLGSCRKVFGGVIGLQHLLRNSTWKAILPNHSILLSSSSFHCQVDRTVKPVTGIVLQPQQQHLSFYSKDAPCFFTVEAWGSSCTCSAPGFYNTTGEAGNSTVAKKTPFWKDSESIGLSGGEPEVCQ